MNSTQRELLSLDDSKTGMSDTKRWFWTMVAVLCVLTGCVSIIGRDLTPKEWGDRLEKVPIGTCIDELQRLIPQFRTNLVSMRTDTFALGNFALVNPLSKDWSTLTFYRQFPLGILLAIRPGDFYKNVNSYDGFESAGDLVVFFDSEGRYKGYFGYGFNRRSADSRARFKAEAQSYAELRIAEKFKDITDEIRKNREYRP